MITSRRDKKISESSSVDSSVEDNPEFPSRTSITMYPGKISASKNDVKPIMPKRAYLGRRKSSKEKSKELSTIKNEALNQVENTIKMTDFVEAKDQKITELKMEVANLKKQLIQYDQKLSESNSIKKELLNKLQSQDDIISRQRISLENIRTEGFAKSLAELPKSAETDYSEYLNDILESRDRIKMDNEALTQKVKEQQMELQSLQLYMENLERNMNGGILNYKQMERSTMEDRPKSDLLTIIRGHMDDKIVWIEYAIKLTQQAVSRCPQLLEINPESPEAELSDSLCNQNRCRWAKLAIRVLTMVSEHAPKILQAIINSADQDQQSYIRSSVK